ncbi:kelch-like protein 5 [Pollicipes pollicipes]|uniref:kelch-like protein 5 n=1 Tax=Pollicipes pollicipes TaxID=41117 RepID=UPI001884B56C|nr:kelch-like protein 5 [Pollicipes pollicipes]
MLQRRGGVGVGVVNGCLYALGGSDAPATSPNSLKFSCVERYDPNTDQWTEIASMVIGRDGVAACALGQWLFAVGGSDGQQYLRLVECYDPQTNEWKKSAPLSIARAARLCGRGEAGGAGRRERAAGRDAGGLRRPGHVDEDDQDSKQGEDA